MNKLINLVVVAVLAMSAWTGALADDVTVTFDADVITVKVGDVEQTSPAVIAEGTEISVTSKNDKALYVKLDYYNTGVCTKNTAVKFTMEGDRELETEILTKLVYSSDFSIYQGYSSPKIYSLESAEYVVNGNTVEFVYKDVVGYDEGPLAKYEYETEEGTVERYNKGNYDYDSSTGKYKLQFKMNTYGVSSLKVETASLGTVQKVNLSEGVEMVSGFETIYDYHGGSSDYSIENTPVVVKKTAEYQDAKYVLIDDFGNIIKENEGYLMPTVNSSFGANINVAQKAVVGDYIVYKPVGAFSSCVIIGIANKVEQIAFLDHIDDTRVLKNEEGIYELVPGEPTYFTVGTLTEGEGLSTVKRLSLNSYNQVPAGALAKLSALEVAYIELNSNPDLFVEGELDKTKLGLKENVKVMTERPYLDDIEFNKLKYRLDIATDSAYMEGVADKNGLPEHLVIPENVTYEVMDGVTWSFAVHTVNLKYWEDKNENEYEDEEDHYYTLDELGIKTITWSPDLSAQCFEENMFNGTQTAVIFPPNSRNVDRFLSPSLRTFVNVKLLVAPSENIATLDGMIARWKGDYVSHIVPLDFVGKVDENGEYKMNLDGETQSANVKVEKGTDFTYLDRLINSNAYVGKYASLTIAEDLTLPDNMTIGVDTAAFCGTIDGKGNTIYGKNMKLMLGKEALVKDITLDNGEVEAADGNKSEDETLAKSGKNYYYLFADKLEGTLSNCVLRGTLTIDETEANGAVACMIGSVNDKKAVDNVVFYFDNENTSGNKSLKAQTVIMQNVGIGRHAGETAKSASNSRRGNKAVYVQPTYDEDEVNLYYREYTDEEMASGEPAFWLNYPGKGYTGDYTSKWSMGPKHPILASELSKPVVKLVYQIDEATKEEAGLSNPVHFANIGDEIEINVAKAPTKVWLGAGNGDGVELNSSTRITRKLISEASSNGIITIHLSYEKPTDIESAKEQEARIYVSGKSVCISGAEGERYVVYDTIGRIVAEGVVSSSMMSLVVSSDGMYVVKAGSLTQKIIVR